MVAYARGAMMVVVKCRVVSAERCSAESMYRSVEVKGSEVKLCVGEEQYNAFPSWEAVTSAPPAADPLLPTFPSDLSAPLPSICPCPVLHHHHHFHSHYSSSDYRCRLPQQRLAPCYAAVTISYTLRWSLTLFVPGYHHILCSRVLTIDQTSAPITNMSPASLASRAT